MDISKYMASSLESVKKTIKSAIFSVLNLLICKTRKTSFDKLSYDSIFFKTLAYFASEDLQKSVVWHKAVENSDVKKISQLHDLFGSQIDIDARRFQISGVSSTALELAISKNHSKMIKKLKEIKAKSNTQSPSSSALLNALEDDKNNGKEKQHNVLLNLKTMYNPKSDEERKAVSEIIEILTKNSGDVSVKNQDGNTILHIAVESGIKDLVEYFIRYAPDLAKIKNLKGQIPLHIAVISIRSLPEGETKPETIEIVEILVKFAPNTIFIKTLRNFTALEIASVGIFLGSFKIRALNILLSAKTDNPITDESKQNYKNIAFSLAIKTSKPLSYLEKAIEYLGKEVIYARDGNDNTTLHMVADAYYYSRDERKIVANFLINSGVDQTAENRHRETYESLILKNAIINGNLSEVKKLLSEGAIITDKMFLSVANKIEHIHNSKDFIQYLLENGANINAKDKDGDTLLHIIAQRHYSNIDFKLLDFLQAKITDSSITNSSGQTYVDIILSNAIFTLNKKGFDFVIRKYHPNFDIIDSEKRTLLHMAADVGSTEMIEILQKKVANPESLDKSNLTYKERLLIHAVKKDERLIEKAIKLGADLGFQDIKGRTILHIIAKNQIQKMIELFEKGESQSTIQDEHLAELFKEKGVADDIEDNYGLTYQDMISDENKNMKLCAAIEAKNKELVKEIASLMINRFTIQDKDGNTALHLAAQKNDLEIFKTILTGIQAKKLDELRVKNNLGKTVLDEIVGLGNADMALLWINLGADVNSVDKKDNTHLHLAVSKGYTEMAQTLIASGANVNAVNGLGETVLHRSIFGENAETVKLLINSGADVNAANYSGRTALYWAVSRGKFEIIELLVNSGANVNAVDGFGETVLSKAIIVNDTKIIQFLKSKGAGQKLIVNEESEISSNPEAYMDIWKKTPSPQTR